MANRMKNNVKQLEKDTAEKKLFDPLKAKAQIQVYKEIYNLEDPEEKEKMRLLKSASDDDVKVIGKYFKENDDGKSEEE